MKKKTKSVKTVKSKKTVRSVKSVKSVKKSSKRTQRATYAKALRDTYSSLQQTYKLTVSQDLVDPVEQMVLGILWRSNTQRQADSALKVITDSMVDFNELRVTPPSEINELIGKLVSHGQQKSLDITKALNWFFTRYNTLDLSELRERDKTELKDVFTRADGLDAYSSGAVLVMSFAVHIIPLDTRMLDYLKEQGALDPEMEIAKAQTFLGQKISADNTKEFFLLLRKHAETRVEKKAKKTKQVKKVKKTKAVKTVKKVEKVENYHFAVVKPAVICLLHR